MARNPITTSLRWTDRKSFGTPYSRKHGPSRSLSIEECEPRLCLSAVSFSHGITIDDSLWADSRGEGDPIYEADLDGDDDLDLLVASDQGPAWYENTDGAGTFGPAQYFENESILAYTVHAADLDGDEDLDVLSCLRLQDFLVPVVWYENTDGLGAFGPRQIATEGAAYFIRTPDLDGDGDVDILWGAHARTGWYENIDGAGDFGPMHTLSSHRSPDAGDFDGDGDVDVLTNRRDLVWLENNGAGEFDQLHVIAPDSPPGANAVADLDGDADPDVIRFASRYMLYWYENVDGGFATEHVLAQTHASVELIRPADLDGDGDTDVAVIVPGSTMIRWYENADGQGTFGPLMAFGDNIDRNWALHLSDLNGDGHLDAIAATEEGKLVWYEQLSRLMSGDANRDGEFNELDVLQILRADKYLSGEPAVWEEGDWNTDGLFNQLDIVAALQHGQYIPGDMPV